MIQHDVSEIDLDDFSKENEFRLALSQRAKTNRYYAVKLNA